MKISICKDIVTKNIFKVWSKWLEARSLEIFSFLARRRLSSEKENHHVRRHLELHRRWGSFISNTKRGWKISFLASQMDWLWRKDFTSYISIASKWELSNKKRKNVEGVQLPETALPKVQTWTANGERQRRSLVTWLLEVCGHTYSEKNVDLKLP